MFCAKNIFFVNVKPPLSFWSGFTYQWIVFVELYPIKSTATFKNVFELRFMGVNFSVIFSIFYIHCFVVTTKYYTQWGYFNLVPIFLKVIFEHRCPLLSGYWRLKVFPIRASIITDGFIFLFFPILMHNIWQYLPWTGNLVKSVISVEGYRESKDAYLG